MSAPAPAVLVLLMRLVPALPSMIRGGLIDPDIYACVLLVINESRSPDFIEWDHLERIMRQDIALLEPVIE